MSIPGFHGPPRSRRRKTCGCGHDNLRHHQGTSGRRSELAKAEGWRFGAGAVGEEVVGRDGIVAQELECGTGRHIGAGTRGHVENASSGSAVFSAVSIRDHTKLGYGVCGGKQRGARLAGICIGRPVEQVLVLVAARSVDRDELVREHADRRVIELQRHARPREPVAPERTRCDQATAGPLDVLTE
jgi:hypothetical protein